MKTDNELRRDVEHELEWEPSVDERRIGVSVQDGIVTLTGEVSSYAERWKAERAVERVAGVKAIVNELQVHTPNEQSDVDLAKAAVEALKWNIMVPSDRIKVKVSRGWLTLAGEVDWHYQKGAAERAVRDLPGLKGVTNLIAVRPHVEPNDIKRKIEEAFKREALVDAENLTVEVSGSEVTLRGTVHSWAERREAEEAAWAAPGVTAVHNYLVVSEAA
jgi:osmotically-inducible protein OsmY